MCVCVCVCVCVVCVFVLPGQMEFSAQSDSFMNLLLFSVWLGLLLQGCTVLCQALSGTPGVLFGRVFLQLPQGQFGYLNLQTYLSRFFLVEQKLFISLSNNSVM